jgi:hypothetical protein
VDFAHIAGVAVVTTGLAIEMGNRSDWLPWLSLASLVAAGVQVALVGIESEAARRRMICARALGWFVGGAGVFVLATRFADRNSVNEIWTMLPLWLATWVIFWRGVSRETSAESLPRRHSTLAIPVLEFGSLLMVAAVCEAVFFALAGSVDKFPSLTHDPLFWARAAAYVLASGSAVWHARHHWVWSITTGTLVAATSLITVKAAIEFDGTLTQRSAWGALSGGFAIAFIAHWLPGISRVLGRVTHDSPNLFFNGLVQATWKTSAMVALVGVMVVIGMMVVGAPAADIQLAIVTVATG